MNGEREDGGGLDRVEAVSLYMEALKARMDPGQYERLARLVHESAHLLAQGRDGIFGDEDGQAELTPEMQRELATILAMMINGGADYQAVEMPGPNGSTGFAIVEASAADDPEKLQETRESLHRWAAEREAIDSELDGIDRASEPDETD
ncbi:hypothetical protein ABZY93_26110 [Streptomyces smyrnaeus]|uniref:hypothetical protein n=1 Tax=Streptomyces smyrnaeus TaxID=1387713 RepID=UPI00339DD808